MNESPDTPPVPPPGHLDATLEQRLDRLHAALQAAQEAQAAAVARLEGAFQAVTAALAALNETQRLASAAERAWHRGSARIERLSKKGRGAA